jgi:hypothetical protein
MPIPILVLQVQITTILARTPLSGKLLRHQTTKMKDRSRQKRSLAVSTRLAPWLKPNIRFGPE